MNIKKNIYLMYIIALLQGMVFYGSIATLYRQAQGVSVFQITLIESISLILCLVLEIPWGVIADKAGYKKTFVFCCCLYFISKIVFWLASGFWWFLLERIMLSIVISGISGVDVSILYLSCEEGKSQKVFGIYDSLGMIGLLTASVIFSVCVRDNYKLAGGLTVISYGLAAVAAFGLTEVKDNKQHNFSLYEFKMIFKQIFKNKYLILFLIATAFLSETHQTITVFLNQIQYEKCGLQVTTMGYIFIAVTLVSLCSVWSYRFTKKVGVKLASTLLYSIATVSCILLAFTKNAVFSIGGIMALRISNSLFQPFQMELQNKQVQTKNRATEISIYAMIIDTVGVGTNLVFGALATNSLSAAFIFGAGLCLTGLCLFLIWYKHWKRINI